MIFIYIFYSNINYFVSFISSICQNFILSILFYVNIIIQLILFLVFISILINLST